MTDVFGQALLDHHRDEREQPLYQRDGDSIEAHPIVDFYRAALAKE